MRRIFLVTPLRDEIDNLPKLIECIKNQTVPITAWVIVENGSTDGSREMLDGVKSVPNVSSLVVINMDAGEVYGLGFKYARIVRRGFNEVLSRFDLNGEDLIGINDADSFPEPTYYESLLRSFADDEKLGITSGLSFDLSSGTISRHARGWVRGSCRLWRGACFLGSGYVLGPSADTLSVARAELDGWKVKVTRSAAFKAREVGDRSKGRYYGQSAHFRGHTLAHTLLRVVKYAGRGEVGLAVSYLSGFLGALLTFQPRIDDKELRSYFRRYNSRLIRRGLMMDEDADQDLFDRAMK